MKRKEFCLFKQKKITSPVIQAPTVLRLRDFFPWCYLFTCLDFAGQIVMLGTMNYVITAHDDLGVQYRAVQLFLPCLWIQGRTAGERPSILWSFLVARGWYWWQLQKPPTNNLKTLTATQWYYVAFAPSHSFHLHFYDKEWIFFNPWAAPQRKARLIQMKWSNATPKI